MIYYLSEEEILLTHHKLIERYGGSHGVRDIERVRSVLFAPAQEAFGQEQYPDIWQKAAVYARNIIGDHPFADGNKRTGVTAALMFLKINNIKYQVTKGELENFAIYITTKKPDITEIATWFKGHSTKK